MSSILKPVLGSQIQYGHPLARGLVGCWLMNEGAGNLVQDLSGNGLNLTLLSGTEWAAGDLLMSGTNTGASRTFTTGRIFSNLTIIAAVRITGDSTFNTILSWGADSGTLTKGLWFAIEPTATGGTSKLGLYLAGVGNFWSIATPTLLLDSKWHQLAATWDGTTITYYIDGVAFDTDAASGTITYTPASDNNICIGCVENTAFEHIGQISYVIPFNRFLPASEIAQLYREPFCMFERSPIELWTGAMGGEEPPVGNPGIMTTWGGYWGATY